MRTRWLLSCGVLAGPLFVGTFCAAGRSRTDYDVRRAPVSTLVHGPSGWVQTANFLVAGTLTCAGAFGARRPLASGTGARSIPSLMGAVGLGLIGAGTFATDPVDETATTGLSRRGALHLACSVPVFVGMPLACLVGARRLAADGSMVAAGLSAACGLASIGASVLAGRGWSGTNRLTERGGTFQRVAIVTGLGWFGAFEAGLRRRGA